jgi:hypothetical protein
MLQTRRGLRRNERLVLLILRGERLSRVSGRWKGDAAGPKAPPRKRMTGILILIGIVLMALGVWVMMI